MPVTFTIAVAVAATSGAEAVMAIRPATSNLQDIVAPPSLRVTVIPGVHVTPGGPVTVMS